MDRRTVDFVSPPRLVNHTFISRQLNDEYLAAMFATSLMDLFRGALVELSRLVVFITLSAYISLTVENLQHKSIVKVFFTW